MIIGPDEALAGLAGLPAEARRLLARMVVLYLAVPGVPPTSVAPPRAAAAISPLVEAGLAREDEAAFAASFDPDWGPSPPGWPCVDLRPRLVGAVAAVLSGEPQDGDVLLSTPVSALRRFG